MMDRRHTPYHKLAIQPSIILVRRITRLRVLSYCSSSNILTHVIAYTCPARMLTLKQTGYSVQYGKSFEGLISDFRIYNRGFNPAEVTSYYNTLSQPVGSCTVAPTLAPTSPTRIPTQFPTSPTRIPTQRPTSGCDGTAKRIQSGLYSISGATLQDLIPVASGGPNLILNGDFSFNSSGSDQNGATIYNDLVNGNPIQSWDSYGGGTSTYAIWGDFRQ